MHDDLTKIRIMADYGEAYAWDQCGTCIGLGYNFEDIPEIQAIEDDFIKWAGDFWAAEDDDPNFPWEEFHKRGIALTARLNQAIPENIDIEISYSRPDEDPKGKGAIRDGRIVFRNRKNG